MRDLKFRAFHATSGMVQFTMNDLYNFSAEGARKSSVCFQDGDIYDLEDVDVMQYTGLKDAKGVEIYLDDIVTYRDDSGTPQTGIVNDYGYYHGFIQAIGGDDEGNQDGELHPDSELYVIGNIYSNPELLK